MVKNRKRYRNLAFLLFIYSIIHSACAVSPLRFVGSSAVFPFAATVAEHFHYKTHEPTPLIEATGTGAGIKLFCKDPGGPDGVMTSRPLTESEQKKCQENGVVFKEFKLGQDGLVFIQNNQEELFSLSLKNLDHALHEKILYQEKCIENPYKNWRDIQDDFPPYPIQILGPAPTSGTYDVLIEKIMGSCGPSLRRDGAYIEAPANENLIVQKALLAPHIIGVVTFSFYDQNRNRLHAFSVGDVFPSFESIQDGTYPLSRPLYLYIKANNLKNDSTRLAYLIEFTSPAAIGEKGYLNEKGLIPLTQQEQKELNNRIQVLKKGEEL
ncbi:MAG: substrate-binding domain-containing protein [Alphaproteobacteria bacterium]|nr:substrate-binding domain-containing protein [Alphaproteobacteria bacterium]